jgi:hypothetical protein
VLPLPWRHCTTAVSRGVIAPVFFPLDHWWEVPFLHRRVFCEPDFRGRSPSMTVGDFTNASAALARGTERQRITTDRRTDNREPDYHVEDGAAGADLRHRSAGGVSMLLCRDREQSAPRSDQAHAGTIRRIGGTRIVAITKAGSRREVLSGSASSHLSMASASTHCVKVRR